MLFYTLEVIATTLLLLSAGAVKAAPAKAGQVLGSLDGLRSDRVDALDATGWACSFGAVTPVKVTLFAREQKGGGTAIASVTANQKSSPEVGKACGVEGAFRFVVPISARQLHTFAGKTIFAIASAASTRLNLPGSAVSLPASADSLENVAGITGLNLLVDCSTHGGLNCATGFNPPAKSTVGPPAYAYAASIVTVPGGYRMFYCSVGLEGGWDGIRSSSSSDGIHWASPVLKVATTGAPGRDLSACDPSVVYFSGFYYLYYGSAYVSQGGNKQTVIQVARSATIDGHYQVFSESGKWGATVGDPPAILVHPTQDVAKSYGAGQPSMVAFEGKLWMWYTDDTYSYPHGNVLLMQSSNPTLWANPVATDTHTVNVDVKRSQKLSQFVMFSVDPVEGKEQVRTRSSKDGLIWSPAEDLSQMPNNPSVFFEQNIGVSGDPLGTLTSDRLLVTYMAPFAGQLNTSDGKDLTGKLSRPQWNLYGSFAPAP